MLANGPHRAKTWFRAYVDSEGSFQPAHPHSLIRAFAVRELWTLYNVSMESNCPDDFLRMRGINLNMCILRMFEDTFLLDAA